MEVLRYVGGTLLLGFTLWLLSDVLKTYIKCKYKHHKDSDDDSVSMYTKDDRRYDVRDRFR